MGDKLVKVIRVNIAKKYIGKNIGKKNIEKKLTLDHHQAWTHRQIQPRPLRPLLMPFSMPAK